MEPANSVCFILLRVSKLDKKAFHGSAQLKRAAISSSSGFREHYETEPRVLCDLAALECSDHDTFWLHAGKGPVTSTWVWYGVGQ